MKRLSRAFFRMSFKKQLILVFLATTLMTLVISILVIKLQISSLQLHTEMNLASLNYNDYRSATCLTARTIKSGLLSYFYTLSQQLEQLVLSHTYFTSNPNGFASNESANPLKFTSQFPAAPDYSLPAQFQYSGSSSNCYPGFSYFDVQLPYLFSMTPDNIKRINILFIDSTNLSQTCIRTIPATSNFSISQTNTFQDLLNENSDENIFISWPYEDVYTPEGQLLMYLGTSLTISNSNLRIILQMELDIYGVEKFFYKRVMYFPNAVVGYIYTDSGSGQSELYSVSNKNMGYNATEIMASNQSSININGTQYIVGLSSFPDVYPIDNLSFLLGTPNGPYTVFALGEIATMDAPPTTLSTFLEQFIYINNYAYGLCAIVTLMTVVSFTYIAASKISSPLSKLSKSTGKFLAGAKDSTGVQIALSQTEPKHQLKTLADNIVSILEHIERQRQQNRPRNSAADRFEFPVNDCDTEFLTRMRSKALSLWEPVEHKLSSLRRSPEPP